MSTRSESSLRDKFILFPVGAKLATLIISLVLLALALIVFFCYYMVGRDAETEAEKNNFEVNRRVSAETEHILSGIRSNAQVLVQIVNTAGVNSEIAKQAKSFFFAENKSIAAIIFQTNNNNVNVITNEDFFYSKGLNSLPVMPYYTETKAYLQRAAKGETFLLNAYVSFSMHLLAFFCPLPVPPKAEGRGMLVVFSPVYFNNSLNFGENQSFLMNSSGDVLVHSDFGLIKDSANLSGVDYVRRIRESVIESRQDLRDIDGIMHYIAFTKLKAESAIVVTGIEYDKIFAEIKAVTRRNFYLSAAVVFITILFVRYFSRNVTIDLKLLSAAARKIEDGDFDIELEPRTRDEIGFLTYNFQHMSDSLASFVKFSNREIALKSLRGEINSGGDIKHASIFSCGIRGFPEKYERFTNECGRSAPDKLLVWLNDYFSKVTDCVEKTYGIVDKFIGDSCLAHWGTANTTGSPAKDAFNCVKSALLMRKTLYMINREQPQNTPLNISCGIASGVVTAGQVGSANRAEYTVIGDALNLAFKIQELNRRFGTDILISESAWNLVKFFYNTEEMPSVKIAGQENPLRVFAVINHVSVTNGPKDMTEVRKMLGIKPPANLP
jgi:adenylate cyclase